ncbi:CPBP family intramembrane metalloprotease [Candidatus Microgenomates bacterium]|nr:CPBP family intramembrane metalloprotease [Candidatus Microgenomates bacterium]
MADAPKRRGISHLEKALNIYGIVLIIWSLYRFYFKLSQPLWFDEFIAKPAIFILPVWYFISRYEKKSLAEGLHFRTKSPVIDIIAGLLIGSVFFIISALRANGVHLVYPTVFLYVAIALATSISEEIVARGFILNRLYDSNKNAILSSIYASILFFFLRVPILFVENKLAGSMLVQTLAVNFVLSLVISLLFVYRRSLTFAVAIHFMYALSFYLFVS